LPVPAGVRVPAHGLRLCHGVGAVRADHGRHRRAAARLAPAGALRGGAIMTTRVPPGSHDILLAADELPPDTRTVVTGVARHRQPPGRTTARRIVVTAALILLSVVFVYPFVWLVSASFKPRGDVFDDRLLPRTVTWDHYLDVWQQAPLALWMLNTLIVTVLAAATVTISSAMVAWAFSYYRFPGRRTLFGLVLATMMLPGA